MEFSPLPVSTLVGAFLLAFPALFSIVNPVGAALIFHQMLVDHPAETRRRLAPTIALYAFFILLGSLLLGGYVLNFFGVRPGRTARGRRPGGGHPRLGPADDPGGARGAQGRPGRGR